MVLIFKRHVSTSRKTTATFSTREKIWFDGDSLYFSSTVTKVTELISKMMSKQIKLY